MISVLLVDDQVQILEGLRLRLSLEPDIAVIAEAQNASQALALAENLRPDAVIMDIELPGMDGIVATALLRKALPATCVIIHSMHDDDLTTARARAAGASACVPKGAMDGVLVSTLRRFAGGGRVQ